MAGRNPDRIKIAASLLLSGATLLICLAAAEVFFRMKDGQPLTGSLPLLCGEEDSHSKQKIDWISHEIAKERNITPDVAGLYEAEPVPRTYGRLRQETVEINSRFPIKPSRSDAGCRLWNRNFIESLFCGEKFNGNYTKKQIDGYEFLYLFEPYDSSIFPIYRFMTDSRNSETGTLRFNDFGWGGDAISFVKPENAIRIAFLGASTTQQVNGCDFAYPDYVGHWLNEWAARKGLDVRFEVINAGRAGLKPPDFAAIMKYEIAPAAPDVTVYYEGRNHIVPAEIACACRNDAVEWYDRLRKYALLRRLAGLVQYDILGYIEKLKPEKNLRIPAGMPVDRPDISSCRLMLNLPSVLTDMDSVRAANERIGSALVIGSFAMLTHEAVLSEGLKYASVYSYWMDQLGPLRMEEITLLCEYQNRVFKSYCENRNVKFIDVATDLMRQPAAFLDGIHLNCPGMKYHAWIVFLEILPFIEEKIANGELPRKTLQLSSHPFITNAFERVALPYECK